MLITFARVLAVLGFTAATAAAIAADAPAGKQAFTPYPGQEGKDVVWVPSPDETVKKMLDLAQVTSKDYVIDLGSGDGRNIIAAAKRGARGLGVEFNPDMVQLSREAAAAAGVSHLASFVQGDMFEADISQASVMALFLLPDNLRKLTPKFIALRPGTRIVSNTYEIPGWSPDINVRVSDNCPTWCVVLLYVVPARIEGRWNTGDGELLFEQQYQMVSGTYTMAGLLTSVTDARLLGNRISFTLGKTRYEGRVDSNKLEVRDRDNAGRVMRAERID